MAPKKDSPIKLKADADAAEKKGDFARAIELLKLIVQDNPRDWQNVNRIGDLYAKLNKLKEANDQYVKVARYYADDGFFLKAIAVWKKVLRNDPSMLEGSREAHPRAVLGRRVPSAGARAADGGERTARPWLRAR